jgi:hypothetical protein
MVKNATEASAGFIAKQIPIIGTLVNLGFAGYRASQGDWAGAGYELAAGGLGLLDLAAPGLGTTTSLGVEGYLLYRDINMAMNPQDYPGMYNNNALAKGPQVGGVAQDFVFRRNGGVQMFSQDDTIIGSKGGIVNEDRLAAKIGEHFFNVFNSSGPSVVITKEEYKQFSTATNF